MPKTLSPRHDIFKLTGGVFHLRNAPIRKCRLIESAVGCVNSMPFYGWPPESLQLHSVDRTDSSQTFRGRPLYHCLTLIEICDPLFAVVLDPGTLDEMQVFRITPIFINCDFNQLPLGTLLFQ